MPGTRGGAILRGGGGDGGKQSQGGGEEAGPCHAAHGTSAVLPMTA